MNVYLYLLASFGISMPEINFKFPVSFVATIYTGIENPSTEVNMMHMPANYLEMQWG